MFCTSGLLFFFFFQAEDGIRDADVTGVQTCALPIYSFWLRDRRLRGHSYLWMLPIYGADGLFLERLHERLSGFALKHGRQAAFGGRDYRTSRRWRRGAPSGGSTRCGSSLRSPSTADRGGLWEAGSSAAAARRPFCRSAIVCTTSTGRSSGQT